MKITHSDINIIEGELTIDGLTVKGLFEKVKQEPAVQQQIGISAALPVEDLTPGHVFPAVVLTSLHAS